MTTIIHRTRNLTLVAALMAVSLGACSSKDSNVPIATMNLDGTVDMSEEVDLIEFQGFYLDTGRLSFDVSVSATELIDGRYEAVLSEQLSPDTEMLFKAIAYRDTGNIDPQTGKEIYTEVGAALPVQKPTGDANTFTNVLLVIELNPDAGGSDSSGGDITAITDNFPIIQTVSMSGLPRDGDLNLQTVASDVDPSDFASIYYVILSGNVNVDEDYPDSPLLFIPGVDDGNGNMDQFTFELNDNTVATIVAFAVDIYGRCTYQAYHVQQDPEFERIAEGDCYAYFDQSGRILVAALEAGNNVIVLSDSPNPADGSGTDHVVPWDIGQYANAQIASFNEINALPGDLGGSGSTGSLGGDQSGVGGDNGTDPDAPQEHYQQVRIYSNTTGCTDELIFDTTVFETPLVEERQEGGCHWADPIFTQEPDANSAYLGYSEMDFQAQNLDEFDGAYLYNASSSLFIALDQFELDGDAGNGVQAGDVNMPQDMPVIKDGYQLIISNHGYYQGATLGLYSYNLSAMLQDVSITKGPTDEAALEFDGEHFAALVNMNGVEPDNVTVGYMNLDGSNEVDLNPFNYNSEEIDADFGPSGSLGSSGSLEPGVYYQAFVAVKNAGPCGEATYMFCLGGDDICGQSPAMAEMKSLVVDDEGRVALGGTFEKGQPSRVQLRAGSYREVVEVTNFNESIIGGNVPRRETSSAMTPSCAPR